MILSYLYFLYKNKKAFKQRQFYWRQSKNNQDFLVFSYRFL